MVKRQGNTCANEKSRSYCALGIQNWGVDMAPMEATDSTGGCLDGKTSTLGRPGWAESAKRMSRGMPESRTRP